MIHRWRLEREETKCRSAPSPWEMRTGASGVFRRWESSFGLLSQAYRASNFYKAGK